MLLEKYSKGYQKYGSRQSLQRRVELSEATDLKSEMAQAMRDIQLINKELEGIDKKKQQ
jgi:hypothetical protein